MFNNHRRFFLFIFPALVLAALLPEMVPTFPFPVGEAVVVGAPVLLWGFGRVLRHRIPRKWDSPQDTFALRMQIAALAAAALARAVPHDMGLGVLVGGLVIFGAPYVAFWFGLGLHLRANRTESPMTAASGP